MAAKKKAKKKERYDDRKPRTWPRPGEKESIPLPPLPDQAHRPYVELNGIHAELMADDSRYSTSFTGMTIEGIEIRKGGVVVGKIESAIGCGIALIDVASGRVYGVNPLDIWRAFTGKQEVVP